MLKCGHRCPGLCGEVCPVEYCQECCSFTRKIKVVDRLKNLSYRKIDLDRSPIVVLSCGHFFTAQTLDCLLQMSDVYLPNADDAMVELRKNTSLAMERVKCPDCQRPLQQYVTKRYNRLVNKAIADKLTVQLLRSSEAQLQQLTQEVEKWELELQSTRQDFKAAAKGAEANLDHSIIGQLEAMRELRESKTESMTKKLLLFHRKLADKNSPIHMLHSEIVRRQRLQSASHFPVLELAANFAPDLRIVSAAEALHLKATYISLADQMSISRITQHGRRESAAVNFFGPVSEFLSSGMAFITHCDKAILPKLDIEVRLYYAQTALQYRASVFSTNEIDTTEAEGYVQTARVLMEKAREMCSQQFLHADLLRMAIDASIVQLWKSWDEPIKNREMRIILAALVPDLRPSTGTWLICDNGHPVRIPFELCMMIKGCANRHSVRYWRVYQPGGRAALS